MYAHSRVDRLITMNEKRAIIDDDARFEGIEESEFEAIVEKALGIPPEQAKAIREEYPEQP